MVTAFGTTGYTSENNNMAASESDIAMLPYDAMTMQAAFLHKDKTDFRRASEAA